MKARYKKLHEHSLDMALAAIEIYNKPNFASREQIFCILLVNAWESLFKAKILKENSNKLTVLYMKSGGRYKKGKEGQYLTIDITQAMGKCNIPKTVEANIYKLISIRNAATHLTAQSHALPYLVFSLGTAALYNYVKLTQEWFDANLSEYSFYIMPMSFSYPFQSFTTPEIAQEPEDIQRLLHHVAEQQSKDVSDDGFHFTCDIKINIQNAKKISQDTHATVGIGNEQTSHTVVERKVKPTDQYPYTYTEALKKIKQQIPELKQHSFNIFIRDHNIKGNTKYSTYSYRSKLDEQRGPKPNTSVIYNEDFIRLCVAHFQQ